MKLIFTWIGYKLPISRDLKKEKKEEIQKALWGRPINLFKCKTLDKTKIYQKNAIDIDLFKNHIKNSNYYLGFFWVKNYKVYFLIDIGELMFISDQYYIYPKKNTIVKLITEKLWTI